MTRVGICSSVRKGQAIGHGESRPRSIDDREAASTKKVIAADRRVFEKNFQVTAAMYR